MGKFFKKKFILIFLFLLLMFIQILTFIYYNNKNFENYKKEKIVEKKILLNNFLLEYQNLFDIAKEKIILDNNKDLLKNKFIIPEYLKEKGLVKIEFLTKTRVPLLNRPIIKKINNKVFIIFNYDIHKYNGNLILYFDLYSLINNLNKKTNNKVTILLKDNIYIKKKNFWNEKVFSYNILLSENKKSQENLIFNSIKNKVNCKKHILEEKDFFSYKEIDNIFYNIIFLTLKENGSNYGYLVFMEESPYISNFYKYLNIEIFLGVLFIFIFLVILHELKKSFNEIIYESTHDKLTKIGNRDFLENKIDFIKNKWKKKVSICLFDIDNFKKINDNYGHLVGDKVLVELTKRIKSVLNEDDIFIRWGGEEFLIICNLEKDIAISKAEKLREIVENMKIKNLPKFTITMGVVSFKEVSFDLDRAFSLADKRLYYGKENGKNVVIYEDDQIFKFRRKEDKILS